MVENDDYGGVGPTPPIPPPAGGRDGSHGGGRDSDDCPLHQAFCVGWDWLTEQGDAGSSFEDPAVFDESDEMVQDLMHSEGAEKAMRIFQLNGQSETYYGHEVHFSDYFDGFIFADTWTETFLGGHVYHVVNNGNGTATLTVRNTSGLASLTHNPESNYQNPSVQQIFANLSYGDPKSAFEYMPKRLPTSVSDFMYNYSPSSIFSDIKRDGTGWGGSYYQVYTWTVPSPKNKR
jgi:hypothetical protein